jgi:uncharacterized protein (TIGR00369 family)
MERPVTDSMTSGQNVIDHVALLRWLAVRPVPPRPPASYAAEMSMTPETANMRGGLHGGAMATLIDHVGAHCANRGLTSWGPTADMHIRYLALPTGDSVRADAYVVQAGRRLVIVEVRVVDSGDRLVALATLSVTPLNPKAVDEPGRP